MGKKRVTIDTDQLEKLLEIQCTLNEVAAWFRCSEDTIERTVKEKYGMTFREFRASFSEIGKVRLRDVAFRKAVDEGNITMLIFLMKNILGYSDRQEQRIELDTPKIDFSKVDTQSLRELLRDAEKTDAEKKDGEKKTK